MHFSPKSSWPQRTKTCSNRDNLHDSEITLSKRLEIFIGRIAEICELCSSCCSCRQFVYRPASGSGIPEVIGFLNGTVMRHVLNLPTFCVKFFSCSAAVGAGLPVGPEGPMIHIGYGSYSSIYCFRHRLHSCSSRAVSCYRDRHF